MKSVSVVVIIASIVGSSCSFIGGGSPQVHRSSAVSMGIFDDLQLIFSDEGKKNRAEYERRERENMEAAQLEILERRRNPAKMQQYENEVNANRQKLQKEREIYNFQNKAEKGYDPLTAWKRLREEGKIKIGSDLQRDEGSRRLGSEGLIDVRVDERMPYIDQGYISEDADFMGKLTSLFGGGKKKE